MRKVVTRGFKISVRKVSKDFGIDSKVLSNISFDVASGEIVAICGLSGVGKSTLLRIVSGLIAPTKGEVRIDGKVVTKPSIEMGFVTQDYSRSLFPWLNVGKNVALPFKGHDISKSERNLRVQEALASVGLEGKSNSYPWQLSGGMQQRVAIARALIMKPRLLILDEPFASVDAYVRLELEDLVADLVEKSQVTTIIVTHDIDEAIYLADRVIALSDSPATVTMELAIKLKRPRTQMITRSDPKFLKLRETHYKGLRCANV